MCDSAKKAFRLFRGSSADRIEWLNRCSNANLQHVQVLCYKDAEYAEEVGRGALVNNLLVVVELMPEAREWKGNEVQDRHPELLERCVVVANLRQ